MKKGLINKYVVADSKKGSFSLLQCLHFCHKQKLHEGKLVAMYFSLSVVLHAAKLKYLK